MVGYVGVFFEALGDKIKLFILELDSVRLYSKAVNECVEQ